VLGVEYGIGSYHSLVTKLRVFLKVIVCPLFKLYKVLKSPPKLD
jgi:hypothetical protein